MWLLTQSCNWLSMFSPLLLCQTLADLSLSSLVHFLPMILTQLFRVLSHSSKEMEPMKANVLV